MAEHIIEMRPEGANDYGDIVYPKTKANAVIDLDRFGSASGTNAYAVTIGSVPQLYVGLRVTVMFTNANTGASTLNVNGLGAKPIIKANGSGLSSGNIKAGSIQSLVYNGTSFQLVGEGGEYGTATASDVLQGKTIGTEGGLINGSMANYGGSTSATTATANINSVDGFNSDAGGAYGVIKLKSPFTGYVNTNTIISHNVYGLNPSVIKLGQVLGKAGLVTGTYRGEGNAAASHVLSPYTFSTTSLSNATGAMPNRGAVTNTITTQGGSYTIPAGYHNGAGKVTASFSNLVASNVKSGVNIGGIVGTYEGIVATAGGSLGNRMSGINKYTTRSMQKFATITVPHAGSYRVGLSCRDNMNNAHDAGIRVEARQNGTVIGSVSRGGISSSERDVALSTPSVSKGSVIELWASTDYVYEDDNDSAYVLAAFANFSVAGLGSTTITKP